MATTNTTTEYIPTSLLGWIDFSEKDRQKVMQVMELIKGEGTVDELGVGVVRNALSDAMFPGIITVMTKAKYFFIVPRILHSYITEKPAKISAKEYLRRRENEVMELLARQNNYQDNTGVIGVTVAKENLSRSTNRQRELTRKPSAIYWNGLKSFGIYKGDLSSANLLLLIDKRMKNSNIYTYLQADGESGNDRDADFTEPWFSLPDYDKNWIANLSIDLTAPEANFLKHRILDEHPNSLLAQVAKEKNNTREFLKAASFQEMKTMPFVQNLSNENQTVIKTAYCFWQILYGAHIRFNMLLHSRYGSEDFFDQCNEWWRDWIDEMKHFDWQEFDRALLWRIVKNKSYINPFTERFINEWIDYAELKHFDEQILERLIETQETRNKGNRSKLRMYNEEKYSAWVGINNMNYRFGNAKIIIRDITSLV